MASTRSTNQFRRGRILIAPCALVLCLTLSSCGAIGGSNRQDATTPSKHGVVDLSRAYSPTSFAQVRSNSVAIVEATAGDTSQDTVKDGQLAGLPLTQTSFQVNRVIWGKLAPSSISVSQVATSESLVYLSGQRYLLFLMPASLNASSTNYSASFGLAYQHVGDTFTRVGVPQDSLPAALPTLTADQLVSGP